MVHSPFCIYGAGIVATSIYTALKMHYMRIPECFLVSSPEGNPSEIDGLLVKTIDEYSVKDAEMRYLIAVPEVHHPSVEDALLQRGVSQEQIIFVGNRLENQLLENYYRDLPDFETADQLLRRIEEGNESADTEIKVFQAKCHVDRTLQYEESIPDYVCPIQVGASLTDQKIEPLRDDHGPNISDKNRNYSELTAMYYAWKNCQAAYKGLCHYRRIFELSDIELHKLINQGHADVILPYPSVYYPNIDCEHSRYVSEDDWEAMLQALKETAPEYYEAYLSSLSKELYFYNFNMLIAKRAVFDDYCEFMFSVLERTEELTSPKGRERADRFAGYLGENLTTIYFRKNRENLNLVHTGKVWLI